MARIFKIFFAVVFSGAGLTACGGGGSDAPPSAPQSAEAVASVSGVSAANVVQGDTFDIHGAGLSKVTSVRAGTTNLAFVAKSDTALAVTVPQDGMSGALSIQGSGFAVTTAYSITVLGAPLVQSVSSSVLAPGTTLSITGLNLSNAKGFVIDNGSAAAPFRMILAPGQISPTAAVFTLPVTPGAGSLHIVLPSGKEIDTGQWLSISMPMSVSSISPTQGTEASQVTLSGTGFTAVRSVRFGNGAAVPVASTLDTLLLVTVPAGAASGPLTLLTDLESFVTPQSFQVFPRVVVSSFEAVGASDGSVGVTITGSNLDAVSQITIGGVSTAALSTSTHRLEVVAGPSISGDVILIAPAQSPVKAGTVSRPIDASVTFSQMQVAQQFAVDVNDSASRLAARKDTLLRVQLTAAVPNVRLHKLAVSGFLGERRLGMVPLKGPAVVPTSPSAYDASQSWTAELPRSWIQKGLMLQVFGQSGSTWHSVGEATSLSVSDPLALEVVLVPIKIGATAGKVPPMGEVRQALIRTYPFAEENLKISMHSVLDASDIFTLNDAAWSMVLSRLFWLQAAESGRGKVFIGFVPDSTRSTGMVGLGYLNRMADVPTGRAAMTALVDDAAYITASVDPFGWRAPAWASTLVHELGHNMSRDHAPCGSPATADANYPYAGGQLGPAPVWDSVTGIFSAPLVGTSSKTMYDVMGYCNGLFFSDYNWQAVLRYAESFTQYVERTSASSIAPLDPAGGTEPSRAAFVRGEIAGDVVSFYPVGSGFSSRSQRNAGRYVLRVTTRAGEVINLRFDARELADHMAVPTSHFEVELPRGLDLTDVAVLRDGVVLRRADGPNSAATQGSRPVPGSHFAATSPAAGFEGNDLVVRWGGGVATVVWIDVTGRRRVLALQSSAGSLRFPLGEERGTAEVELASGWRLETVRVTR